MYWNLGQTRDTEKLMLEDDFICLNLEYPNLDKLTDNHTVENLWKPLPS